MGIEDTDVEEEMRPATARKLLSYVLNNGIVYFSKHSLNELAADGRTERDASNVLRAGRIFEPAEWKDDSWRYRVHTARMCVVIAFDSVSRTVVVTAWEKRS